MIDRRTRRVLHDDVLPQLHTAMLLLSLGIDERPGRETKVALVVLSNLRLPVPTIVLRPSSFVGGISLADVHRQIANLLHAMPATAAPELARLGLIDALRQSIDGEFSSAFDGVSWQVEPAAAEAARAVPALTAEVVFYAAREAVRNAARYGRNGEATRALHLKSRWPGAMGWRWRSRTMAWAWARRRSRRRAAAMAWGCTARLCRWSAAR